MDLREQIRIAIGGALAAQEGSDGAADAVMEVLAKQGPVAWCTTDETGTFVEALGMNQSRRFDTPLYLAPGAQPAPSVPDGFSREDLEAVADGLDGYEKTVNVGNVTGVGDDHLESTTAYAARFIRAMLAAQHATSVPGGWKLVPIEPTQEMLRALVDGANQYDSWNEGYRDMLAAAPEPEAKP